MRTSYRNVNFKAAYPFGHGITYTTFQYGEFARCNADQGAVMCLSIDIQNTGQYTARTVAQLYLEFPPLAEYPTPILRGFETTGNLSPGETAHVSFQLSVRDISYYRAGGWEKATQIVAHAGESSADIRRSAILADDVHLQSWQLTQKM